MMGTSLLCMVDSSCRSPCKCFEVCPNGGFLNVVCIMSSSIIKVRIPETSGWKLAIRYTDTTTDTDTEINTDVTIRNIRNWHRPHLRARIRIHIQVSRVPESYKCSRILTRVLTRILSGCGCLCLLWVNWLAVVVCGCPRLLGVNCFLVVACGCLRRFGVNWLAVFSWGCLRMFGVNWLPVLAWGCLRLLRVHWLPVLACACQFAALLGSSIKAMPAVTLTHLKPPTVAIDRWLPRKAKRGNVILHSLAAVLLSLLLILS